MIQSKLFSVCAILVLGFGTLEVEAAVETDVLILGAGWSGISAGKYLYDHDLKDFVILEAREEVGGRVRPFELKWSANEPGVKLELGANWIHGTRKGNPVWDLARQVNLEGKVSDYDSVITYDSQGTVVDDSTIPWDKFDNAYECMELAAERMQEQMSRKRGVNNDKDLSIRASLRKCGWEPETLVDHAVEWFSVDFDIGKSSESSGTAGKQLEWFGPQDFFVTDPRGYIHLLETYASDFLDSHVKLNSEVVNINYKGKTVEVTLRDGTVYVAKMVICTFPTSYLSRKHKVLFTPKLPDWKVDTIELMGSTIGQYTKLFLKFNQAFWDDEYEFILQSSPDMPTAWMNMNKYIPGSNVLVYTLADKHSELASYVMDDAEIVQRAMLNLRTMYPSAPEPTAYNISKFGNDPWTFGAYTDLPVNGFLHHTEILGYPVDKKVFFSGEATDKDYFGSTHGALLAGIRTAKQVESCIRRKKGCPAHYNERRVLKTFWSKF